MGYYKLPIGKSEKFKQTVNESTATIRT